MFDFIEKIAIAAGIILGTVAVVIFIYFFMSFVSWVLSDPFDIFVTETKVEKVEREEKYINPDKQRCRELGGIVKESIWNGTLVDCLMPDEK